MSALPGAARPSAGAHTGAHAVLAANRSRALAAIRPLGLGRVCELVGLHLRITGLRAAVGDLLEVQASPPVLVEVVASSTDGLVCLPLGRLTGIQVGAYVRHTGGPLQIRVGGRYPLADTRRAHEDLEGGGTTGKLVIVP